MFAFAKAQLPEALTSVMFEQLHNIYRLTVWPWQDTTTLANGVRQPVDAAVVRLFEQAKKAPPAEAALQLGELERLSDVACDQLQAAWRERQAQTPPAPAPQSDHRKDKRVLALPRMKDLALLNRLEKQAPLLPLSLRAWIEEAGSVCLAGSHPQLCFWQTANFPGVFADPLMVSIDLRD